MRSGRLAVWLGLAGVLLGSGAGAQSLTPGPPGPFYVLDLRGTTSGIPASPGLYPGLGDEVVVPARGFGFDVGGHVYLLNLGPARLGLGVNIIQVRGTATDANATFRTVAPQLSFNFGTSDGWSYLSLGAGTARVNALETGSSSAINAGGGARWFVTRHIAVGFDIRLHRIAADGDTMGQSTQLSASVGFSVK
jgi:Outer membrane protein beta-barrel domain